MACVDNRDRPRWHRGDRNEDSDPDVRHSSIYVLAALVGICSALLVWRLLGESPF